MPEPATQRDASAVPAAALRPERRLSLAWLIPLAALALAAWIGYRAWQMRGLAVTVELDQGHGLKAGDEVRYRGIAVGIVESLDLNDDLRSVIAHVRLHARAVRLARDGTRFWVVRPQVHLTRVEGLDTLVGPRYLAVLPDLEGKAGRSQRHFIGLAEQPMVEQFEAGDLEIVLHASQRGSLHAGAPVTYRQTRVGTVLSVGLAGDGGSVEARAHVAKPYVGLIREGTRFWDVGGLQAKLGLTGLSIDIDSAEALIAGGIALATPPESVAGAAVKTGHRFALAVKPDEDWLDWQPLVAIGSSLLPVNAVPPSPLRATLDWKQDRLGGLMTRSHRSGGFVLQTSDGLLGPANLVQIPDKAQAGSAHLEVAGDAVPLGGEVYWSRDGLAMIDAAVKASSWPMDRCRRPAEPEDCLAIADPSAAPLPLNASRLRPRAPGWAVDDALPVDSWWHGAAVVAKADGMLVGMLLVDGSEASVSFVRAAASP